MVGVGGGGDCPARGGGTLARGRCARRRVHPGLEHRPGRGGSGGCRRRDGRGWAGTLAAPRGAAPAVGRSPSRARSNAAACLLQLVALDAETTDRVSGCSPPECSPQPALPLASRTARARPPSRACSIATSISRGRGSCVRARGDNGARGGTPRARSARRRGRSQYAWPEPPEGARARLRPDRREAVLSRHSPRRSRWRCWYRVRQRRSRRGGCGGQANR